MPDIKDVNAYKWTHQATGSFKAKIQFYKVEGAKWEQDESCSVQINPSQISTSRGYRYKSKVGRDGTGKEKAVQTAHGEVSEQIIRMTLYFDLVEAYQSLQYTALWGLGKTAEVTSMVTSLFGHRESDASDTFTKEIVEPVNSINDLSLLESKFTCYPRLKKAVVNEEPIKFVWGNQGYFGEVGNFSSRLTYFSSSGDPLRAIANIGIYIMSLDQANNKLKEKKIEE